MATANSWMGKDYMPMMMAYNTMMEPFHPVTARPLQLDRYGTNCRHSGGPVRIR